ncbi:MAG: hypothetical protein FJ320_10185 [SAR202 cluster bacterium]|nr:hypothetical protein [SAR202 cluster bacterium]
MPVKIEVKKVDGRKVMARLRANIRRYERRYETSSAEMLKLISQGKAKDTVEVLRWMFDYHALRRFEDAIRTNGKTSNNTKSSRKSA